MKKIYTVLILALLLNLGASAQFFQGSWSYTSGDSVTFKLVPTGNLTGVVLSYVQADIRYLTAQIPGGLTVTSITSNTAVFPTANAVIQNTSFAPASGLPSFSYLDFVFTGAQTNSLNFTGGTSYDLFTVHFNVTPVSTMQLEMVSDYANGEILFGAADGGGNPWDPGTNPQLTGTGYYRDNGVDYLPLFAPVPVRFMNFNVARLGKDAQLNWTVANEDVLTDKYDVERSLNGFYFAKFATVQPKNNGSSTNTYELTDLDINSLNSATGYIYYRIKQYDKDGKFITTDVRKVKLDAGTISVNPNPVKGSTTLTYTLTSDANVMLNIFDANGQLVDQQKLTGIRGINSKVIDMSRFAAGTYMLNIVNGNKISTLSVIKAK